MFDFLKKKFGKQEALILDEGVKVKDFPASEYDAYWEIYEYEQHDRFCAEIRIYHRKDGLMKSAYCEDSTKAGLQKQTNVVIKEIMSLFKKRVQ